ncbi:MAG: MogA/MoaB family molybdenum cofactor biosynthesis protein [Clostridiales Family XIII bacterium]|jgi:molybdenum cofactor synthesis domain-containing protein|nr:MogA/MoaB family molybdenum cofactor biosynthesis protein [Clostridiales Family XIII bacterium]
MIKVGIITASDRSYKGEREDLSAPRITEILATYEEFAVESVDICPDEQEILSAKMVQMSDECAIDLILTTGGTGFAPRDVTPEATLAVIEKRVPGIPEAMRMHSLESTNRAMLARQEAGIRGKTLIINLPGSPKAVSETLPFILPAVIHGIDMLRGEDH